MPASVKSALDDDAVAALLEDVLVPLDDPAEQPGDQIGAYHLVEKLGEGGFGIVWRAEQWQPVKREVALKMIKLGMDTRQVLARFAQERRVLAAMAHPNIAAMLDAGISPDGRPYFVMELVPGTPLTDYCTGKELPLRQRLELFRTVCMGVQHAHQKGIIHRDLKPSNILVTEIDGTPVPKIIDFGIAKALIADQLATVTLNTRRDATLGTPLYMAPEQLVQNAVSDTRSDVYALGVVLYQLITGAPPFDDSLLNQKNSDALLRAIREVQPVRPSLNLNRAPAAVRERRHDIGKIPADLDWITLRALAKEPERRYQSTAEFAADLEAFLDARPVAAHPPGIVYRAQRWIQRNRLFFGAAGTSLCALVLGAVLALWQAREARQAQRQAEHSAVLARNAETGLRAESERSQATAAFLKHMLDSIAGEVRKGRNPEALQLALSESRAALDQMKAAPELHADLLRRIAILWKDMAMYGEAIALLGEHAAMVERITGSGSRAAREAKLEHIYVSTDFGSREDALRMLRDLQRGIEAAGERGTEIWFRTQKETVRCLVKMHDGEEAVAAADEQLAEAIVREHSSKSILKHRLQRAEALQEARQWEACDEELERCRKIANSENGSASDMLGRIDDRMLYILKEKQDYARAAEVQSGAVARIKQDPEAEEWDVFGALLILSDLEVNAKQMPSALVHADEALAFVRQRISDEGGADTHRGRLAEAELARAEALGGMGRHEEAIAAARAGLGYATAQGDNSQQRKAMKALGYAFKSARLYDQAFATFAEAQETFFRQDGNFRSRYGNLHRMIGIRLLQERWEEAVKLSQDLWRRAHADKDLAADAGHVAHIATRCLTAWQEAHAGDPALPVPPEAGAWEKLADGDPAALE